MAEWNEAMSVGHRTIDEQHRQLIALVNALTAGIAAASSGDGGADGRIAALVAEFFSGYKAHAAYEEMVMNQFFFGNVARHAEHHLMHSDAIATLLLSKPMTEAVRINLPFINSAVIDHIDRDDRDFGSHLKAIGLFGQV